jgi:glycosyltransferase involved in cell wall biosynthesis
MQVLDLAPHCSVPPMDGGDRRAWHLYEGLIEAGARGRFIGRRETFDQTGALGSRKVRRTWRETKSVGALLSIASGRDYWQNKMLTPEVFEAVKECRDFAFDTVIVHFLYSTPLLKLLRGRSVRLVVDTHNYDPVVFGGFKAAARNPFTRMLCQRAIRTSRQALAGLPVGAVLVHVSEADAVGYRKDRGDLAHLVVENGCRMQPRATQPSVSDGEKRRLLFVGSLSAQMNQDGLKHFADNFWPKLKDVAAVCVAGSSPSRGVISLCQLHGWDLRPNLDEGALTRCYEEAHFAMLPFAYGAGSKLKLMEACGRGVPVLSTSAGVTGVADRPPLVQVSDDPSVWVEAVRRCVSVEGENLRQTLKFAEDLSWPRLGARMFKAVEELPPCLSL